MRLTIAVPLIAVAALLAGCGDDTGDATAGDPTSPAATSGSPAPSEEPVSVRKTCAELYRPPAQLMPRAIEFVHGSPSAEGTAEAEELVTALAAAEGHALGPLAEDIAVVREAVDAQRAAGESGTDGPDVGTFDSSSNRLARHCELYND